MTVFVISWVNPDERLAHKDFEDYMLEGPLAALDAIEKATGEQRRQRRSATASAERCSPRRSAISRRRSDKRIASATFMTALVDFTARRRARGVHRRGAGRSRSRRR